MHFASLPFRSTLQMKTDLAQCGDLGIAIDLRAPLSVFEQYLVAVALNPGSGNDHTDGAQDDLEIQPRAPIVDVIDVERDVAVK